MIVLREYQETAVEDLTSKMVSLLQKETNKKLVFRAPTGSGKTIIVAESLKKLVTEKNPGALSFIWAAPRKLHVQSKEKLDSYYYDNKALRCSFFEDLQDKTISENEILFLNWESINKEDNIFIRESEQDFNLSTVLQNTRDQGRQVILIIDESHFTAKTETSQGLINMIQPIVTLEVSATPSFIGDEQVTVQREDVIKDEMIKRYVAINPGLKNNIVNRSADTVTVSSALPESTNEFIIGEALNKREYLAGGLKELGSKVNPLLLIQLPDRKSGLDDFKEEIVGILRDRHSITVENGRLAIYLSEDKQNLDTISMTDDQAEVMIFKQAIALGWDCPRAYILLMLREMHSDVFTIQTVGRIMRMPEFKYYPEEDLNVGYIYTNLSDFSIQGQDALGYLVSQNSKRKNIYVSLDLPSAHLKRFREETRLAPKYIEHFLKAAQETKLKDSLDINVAETYRTVVSNGIIHDIDKTSAYSASAGEKAYLKQTEVEIQREFDLFIIEALKPLFPEARSVSRVKSAIYAYFQNTYPLQFAYGDINVQKIVLAESGQKKFKSTISLAKELYFSEVGKDKNQIISDEKWNVPPALNYSDDYIETQVNLCLVEPFYQKSNASSVEKQFVPYLDSENKEIEWWYKNGEGDAQHFAIPYEEHGEPHAFYVDWIVKYKDGRIGLWDTKFGFTAEMAKAKAKGLNQYIKEQNSNGQNLFGGIVLPHLGSWRYNDNEIYEYDENNLKSWKLLS